MDDIYIDDVARECSLCSSPLCLRQQVMNLSLGNLEAVKCLACITSESVDDAETVLGGLRHYIFKRACFKTQWDRYGDRNACPYPEECYPDACFEGVES